MNKVIANKSIKVKESIYYIQITDNSEILILKSYNNKFNTEKSIFMKDYILSELIKLIELNIEYFPKCKKQIKKYKPEYNERIKELEIHIKLIHEIFDDYYNSAIREDKRIDKYSDQIKKILFRIRYSFK